MTDENVICEKLSPNDVFILSHVGNSVKYVTNANGGAIFREVYLNDTK